MQATKLFELITQKRLSGNTQSGCTQKMSSQVKLLIIIYAFCIAQRATKQSKALFYCWYSAAEALRVLKPAGLNVCMLLTLYSLHLLFLNFRVRFCIYEGTVPYRSLGAQFSTIQANSGNGAYQHLISVKMILVVSNTQETKRWLIFLIPG
jgi:hypothetical protein